MGLRALSGKVPADVSSQVMVSWGLARRLQGGRIPWAPKRGCILDPLAQRSWRLPEADSSQRSQTNSSPPRQMSHTVERHSAKPASPTHMPPAPRLIVLTCEERFLTHPELSTRSTHPVPSAAFSTCCSCAHTLSAHTQPLRHSQSHQQHPYIRSSSDMHLLHTRSPPSRHTLARTHTHCRYTRGLVPTAALQGAGGVCGATRFPRGTNKRLLLLAPPKKGRLSGGSSGRGGPTLRPCPTWRTPHSARDWETCTLPAPPPLPPPPE